MLGFFLSLRFVSIQCSASLFCRSTSSLSQDLMLERFSRGKAKFDKPVSIPSPGECAALPQQRPLEGLWRNFWIWSWIT